MAMVDRESPFDRLLFDKDGPSRAGGVLYLTDR